MMRMFWYNHHTKEAVWDEPKLIKKYGDVEKPFPWLVTTVDDSVPLEGDLGSEISGLAYWHVLAKRQMSRKPDGVYTCSKCLRNISLRRCMQCNANFCFGCYRETHQSPFGFMQNIDFKKKIAERVNDEVFIELLTKQKHTWKRVEPKKCVACNTEKVMAAYSCQQCDMTAICRPCSRRLHAHKSTADHVLLELIE